MAVDFKDQLTQMVFVRIFISLTGTVIKNTCFYQLTLLCLNILAGLKYVCTPELLVKPYILHNTTIDLIH